MKLFRERLLARLIEKHALSQELATKLMSWTHPGFSAHVGDAIPFEDEKAIEDVACCLVRSPLSLKKLVYLDGQKAVLYRSRLNPSLGRNFEAMDPLEWLARMTDHIPDPGRHRTHFHGFYASRVSGPMSLFVVGDSDPQGRRIRWRHRHLRSMGLNALPREAVVADEVSDLVGNTIPRPRRGVAVGPLRLGREHLTCRSLVQIRAPVARLQSVRARARQQTVPRVRAGAGRQRPGAAGRELSSGPSTAPRP